MASVELRNKIISIVNSSDDMFLRMVNALYKSYSKEEPVDFFDELPTEIQEILMESRAQAKRGETRPHAEVMAEYRKKYGIAG